MRLTVLGFHVEYFIHHKYHPKLNTVVWTLDYDRESDLGESTMRHSTFFFRREDIIGHIHWQRETLILWNQCINPSRGALCVKDATQLYARLQS